MKEIRDFAIYISSFDGYSDCWDSFFDIFNTFWSDCEFKKYLVTNYESPNYKGTELIKVGKEKNWVDRTVRSLEAVNEKYILFLLEDYFLSKKIQNEEIEKIVNYMDCNKVFYYRLSKSSVKFRGKYVTDIPYNQSYSVSLQPAIWNKKALVEILKECSHDVQSAWDFEVFLDKKYKKGENKEYIPGIKYDNRDLLGYKNGILKGKWILSTIKYYRKKGIYIDTSKRDVQKVSENVMFNIKYYFSNLAPQRIKKMIKNIMKKLGYRFFTE